jgi:hypothetical protein
MFVAGLWLMPSTVAAQRKYVVKPIAEMKVKQLPKGELFWRVESFPGNSLSGRRAGQSREFL